MREIGDRRAEGHTLNNLGNAYFQLGDVRQAIAFQEQALVIARELGSWRGESITSWSLGLAVEKQGDLAQAAELMQVLVDYYREVGHPDAEERATELEQLRQRLAASQSPPPAASQSSPSTDTSDEG